MTSLDLKKSLEISKAGDQPNGTLKPRYSIKRGLKLVAYSSIFIIHTPGFGYYQIRHYCT